MDLSHRVFLANSVDVAYVGPGPANGFLNSENNNVQILAGAANGGASLLLHPDSEINTASLQEKKLQPTNW